MPINTQTQYVGYLGDTKIEVGYIPYNEITAATGLSSGDISKTHSVPTTLSKVCAGWMVCSSASGGVIGCITGYAHSVCEGHASGIPAIDFTMDISCAGGAVTSTGATEPGDYYLILGA